MAVYLKATNIKCRLRKSWVSGAPRHLAEQEDVCCEGILGLNFRDQFYVFIMVERTWLYAFVKGLLKQFKSTLRNITVCNRNIKKLKT